MNLLSMKNIIMNEIVVTSLSSRWVPLAALIDKRAKPSPQKFSAFLTPNLHDNPPTAIMLREVYVSKVT